MAATETLSRAAVYVRVSTVQQEQGYGLEAQLDETRAYAKTQGWEVVSKYSDVASGKRKFTDRDGLDAAINAAKRGEYDVLLVREVSRFSRTFRDALEAVEVLKQVGVHVSDVQGRSSKDKMVFGMLSLVAEDERERINERIKGGMRVAARKGKFGGGPAPYGYAVHPTRDKESPEWNTLVINEDEPKNVQALFDLYSLPDASIMRVYKEAKERGLLNRDRKPLSKTHIGELLRDRIYIGEGRQREVLEEIVVTPAPGLVDPDQFAAVQSQLESRKLRYYPRSNEKHTYPLRKRIVHDHGDTMWGMGGAKPKRGRVYRCQGSREENGRYCPGTSPADTPERFKMRSVPADIAESYILKLGLDLLDEPEKVAELADQATRTKLALAGNGKTQAQVERKLTGLDAERKQALEQNRKGWLSDDETEAELSHIAARRAKLEAELHRLTQTLDTDTLVDRLARIRVGDDLPDWWDSLGYAAPEPGEIAPGDPDWEQVKAGLLDEANGEAPDQEPGTLSEWAKDYVAHIVTTLDLYLVIPEGGSYLDAYAVMSGPRE